MGLNAVSGEVVVLDLYLGFYSCKLPRFITSELNLINNKIIF